MELPQRMTGQGVRDLNHTGPKKKPEAAEVVAAPTEGAADPIATLTPPVTAAEEAVTVEVAHHG
jgi:hypothetical protein